MGETGDKADGGQYEWTEGAAHPLVAFDYDAVDREAADTPPDSATLPEFASALNVIVLWLCHNGSFHKRGVYNRVITLAYILQIPELNVKTQQQLADKLGLSKGAANALCQSFTKTFKIATSATRISQPFEDGKMRRGQKPERNCAG